MTITGCVAAGTDSHTSMSDQDKTSQTNAGSGNEKAIATG
jgi:hypothetical protein